LMGVKRKRDADESMRKLYKKKVRI